MLARGSSPATMPLSFPNGSYEGEPVELFRMTVVGGEEGTRLWLGDEGGAPFFVNNRRVSREALERDATRPADTRRGVDDFNRGFTAASGRAARNRLAGDEREVGGRIAWAPRGYEYVAGTYSPSTRRLVVAGTHVSREARGYIGLDLYDLQLSADGLAAAGNTLGNHEGWVHEVEAVATVLPDMDFDRRFAEYEID